MEDNKIDEYNYEIFKLLDYLINHELKTKDEVKIDYYLKELMFGLKPNAFYISYKKILQDREHGKNQEMIAIQKKRELERSILKRKEILLKNQEQRKRDLIEKMNKEAKDLFEGSDPKFYY